MAELFFPARSKLLLENQFGHPLVKVHRAPRNAAIAERESSEPLSGENYYSVATQQINNRPALLDIV